MYIKQLMRLEQPKLRSMAYVTMSIRSDTVFADFQGRKMRQQEVARAILDL